MHEDRRIDQDCEERDIAGKYFVKIVVHRRSAGHRYPQSSAGQTGTSSIGSRGPRTRHGSGQTAAVAESMRWRKVDLRSEDCEVSVLTNASEVAEKVSKMTPGPRSSRAWRGEPGSNGMKT